MKKPKQPLSAEWNLLARHPQIAAQWDYERNAPTRPEDVTPGSSGRYWWICSENADHRWQAAVTTRTQGHGCGICAGRVAAPDTCIRARAPQLVREWHPDLNGDDTPDNTTPGSRKNIWWRCDLGHEWKAWPNNRTGRGSGCPTCAKSGTSRIEMRVAAEMITLFEEADWRTKIAGRECDVFISSLDLGIEIDGYYWHRDAAEKERQKEKSLADVGVHLVRFRDDRLDCPDGSVSFSAAEPDEAAMMRLARHLAAICAANGRDAAAATLMAYSEEGVLLGEALFSDMVDTLPGPPSGRSFADLAPDAAKDWDAEENGALGPSQFWPHSHYPAHWRCRTCDHRWRVAIGSRTAGNGCPRCSGRVPTRETSLAAQHPDLLAEWDWGRNTLDPEDILPQSSRELHWVCAFGHRWIAKAQARVMGNTCPGCRLAATSLAARRPDIAAEWHPTDNDTSPDQVSYGSKYDAVWRCAKNAGHVWTAKVNNRTSGEGCPFCSGKRVSPETSLRHKRPDLADQWVEGADDTTLTPDDVTAGSDKSALWRCERGHEWPATVRSRVAGNGCPRCADPLCDVDLESLPKTQVEAKRAGTKFYFTGKPCKHGHIAPRMTGNKNCRECGRLRSAAYYERGSGAGAAGGT